MINQVVMQETAEDFFNRSYINFIAEKAFVWSKKRNQGQMHIWTIEQVKQYLDYLENEK